MSVSSPSISTARDQTQYKAFVRWTNTHLKNARGNPSQISDISKDLCNGVNLAKLAEVLTKQTIRFNEKASNDLIINQNISLALTAFENDGCELVNIHASTIANPDELRMKMGLLWQLIQNYTISSSVDDDNDEGHGVDDDVPQTDSAADQPVTRPPRTNRSQRTATRGISMVDVKNHLIEWVNQQVATLSDEEKATIREITKQPDHTYVCTDLNSNFQDGTLLIAILASLYHDPLLRNSILQQIQAASDKVQEPCEDEERLHAALDHTMAIAQSDFDIPVLMDGRDMHLHPDANTNVTYLSYYVAASTRNDKPKKSTLDNSANTTSDTPQEVKEDELQQQHQEQPEQHGDGNNDDPATTTTTTTSDGDNPTPELEIPTDVTPTSLDSDEIKLLTNEVEHISSVLNEFQKQKQQSDAIDLNPLIQPLHTLKSTQYKQLAGQITDQNNDAMKNRITIHEERITSIISLLEVFEKALQQQPQATKDQSQTTAPVPVTPPTKEPQQNQQQQQQPDINMYLIIALAIAIIAFLVK